MELIRYVHLNPLRARIAKDMNELSSYKWSGHSAIMGKQKAQWQSIGEILGYFGKKKSEAVRQYKSLSLKLKTWQNERI